MKKQHRWLREEISAWREEGIISSDQAQQLADRYPDISGGTDWARVILTSLGVVIFGLGIILFFAYNWQSMHRFSKLAFIGVALMAAHGAGYWYGRPGRLHYGLSESMHLLGTLLFGAGIWLVAQIYHIDEHYPNAYLAWSLAALSLAWALPSLSQGLLALMLVFLWSWFEVFDFHQPNHPAVWLVALGIVPLALKLRSGLLLFFSLLVFLLVYSFTLVRVDDDLVFGALLLIACAMLAGARLLPEERGELFQPARILQHVGGAVWILMVYISTFSGFDLPLISELPDDLPGQLYWGLPVLLATFGWVRVLSSKRLHSSDGTVRLESALVMAVLLLVLYSAFSGEDSGGLNWLLFNLIFLIHGALLVVRGMRDLRWQLTALGGLMLAALIFARFMDLFDSLLIRSLVFLLTGAGLFVMGQLYARRKRRLQTAQQQGQADRQQREREDA